MIVLDNSVLSAFHRLEALHLLSQLYETVIIASGVREEFSSKWTSTTLPTWLHVENLHNKRTKIPRNLNLGKGEAQSMILAQQKEALLAIDDQKAREVAKDKTSFLSVS